MTREGGTKSSISPFLIFFKATKPLSPTSTFCIANFWGGRPKSDNHFWRASAFSTESMSHPHGTISDTFAAALVSLLVEIEHWIAGCLLCKKGCEYETFLCVLCREWSEGRNVVLRIILPASAMSVYSAQIERLERDTYLIYATSWGDEDRFWAKPYNWRSLNYLHFLISIPFSFYFKTSSITNHH